MTKTWPGPARLPQTVEDEVRVGAYVRRCQEALGPGPKFKTWMRDHSGIGWGRCERLMEVEAYHRYFGSPAIVAPPVPARRTTGTVKRTGLRALIWPYLPPLDDAKAPAAARVALETAVPPTCDTPASEAHASKPRYPRSTPVKRARKPKGGRSTDAPPT